MKRIITLTLLATLPGLALAHTDAGHTIMTNLQHILSSPEHLWPLAVAAVVIAAVAVVVGAAASWATHGPC